MHPDIAKKIQNLRVIEPKLIVSERTEPDMSFELFEPDKSPVQFNPDFWLEPMNRTL